MSSELIAEKQQPPAGRGQPTPDKYYSFPQTLAILKNRLDATDREIATWMFFTWPDNGAPSLKRLDGIVAEKNEVACRLAAAIEREDFDEIARLKPEQERLAKQEARERESVAEIAAEQEGIAQANENLVGYRHVYEFDDPPIAGIDEAFGLSIHQEWDPKNPSYLDCLWGMFFLKGVVDGFVGKKRYISFSDLIDRWVARGYCRSEPDAAKAIQSLIYQSRLMDIVPGLGFSRLQTAKESSPPAEWAMYDIVEVEEVEKEDFAGAVVGITSAFTRGEIKHVPAQRFQEQEILRVIRELGYTATAIPKWTPGRPGVKSSVKKELKFSCKVFDLAWERLRLDDRIADACYPSN